MIDLAQWVILMPRDKGKFRRAASQQATCLTCRKCYCSGCLVVGADLVALAKCLRAILHRWAATTWVVVVELPIWATMMQWVDKVQIREARWETSALILWVVVTLAWVVEVSRCLVAKWATQAK